MRTDPAPECPQRQDSPELPVNPAPAQGRAGRREWRAGPGSSAGEGRGLSPHRGTRSSKEEVLGISSPMQCAMAPPKLYPPTFNPQSAELFKSSRVLAHHSQCAERETESGGAGLSPIT